MNKKVEEYFATLEKHDLFNGMVFIVKKDKILVNQAYGYANYEHHVKNTPQTKFRIASLSKVFTKLAILQLSEKKLLHFDDPLSKFFLYYPNGEKITIQQLLDHKSGIPHLNDFPNYDQLAKEQYELNEVIPLFKNKSLDFPSGTKESYSNSGYVLLVAIIEKTTGISFEKYLQENIFQPAKMKNTGNDSGKHIIKNLAKGYMMNLEGKGLQLPLYYNPSIKIGGGSLYATVEDIYHFHKSYQEGNLSITTEPLFNQGIYGKSPGYTALMWGMDDIFVVILSNNYNTPIKKVAWDISNLMLGKKYSNVEINEDKSISKNTLMEYEGNFKIGKDVETIAVRNDVLIEYENGDIWGGCRLIPIGKDVFYDTCYMEKLTFHRDEKEKVISFTWENGDKAVRVFNK